MKSSKYRALVSLVAGMLLVVSFTVTSAYAAPPQLTFTFTSPATIEWTQMSDYDGDGWAIQTDIPDHGGYSIDIPVMGRFHLQADNPPDFRDMGTQCPLGQSCGNGVAGGQGPDLSIFFTDGSSIRLHTITFIAGTWGDAATTGSGGFSGHGGWFVSGSTDQWPGTCPLGSPIGRVWANLVTPSSSSYCPILLQKTVSSADIDSPFPSNFKGKDTRIDFDAITIGQKIFTKPHGRAATGD